MTEVRDQVLTGDVALDGAVFRNCTFRNARLVYEGGLPPGFDNCSFQNSHFSFLGPAAYTLGFLKAMAPARTGMRGMVLGLIPELND